MSRMTKKDFELIARALAAARPLDSNGDRFGQWAATVASVAVALDSVGKTTFRTARFSDACLTWPSRTGAPPAAPAAPAAPATPRASSADGDAALAQHWAERAARQA